VPPREPPSPLPSHRMTRRAFPTGHNARAPHISSAHDWKMLASRSRRRYNEDWTRGERCMREAKHELS